MKEQPFGKVLVTGAGGLLGRYVVDKLLSEGIEVRAFDRIEGAADVEWMVGDITDPKAVDAAVSGVDAVLHIAAIANIWNGTGEQIMHTNVMGTWLVFDAAQRHRVARVVFCSSDSVAGYTVREGKMLHPRYAPLDNEHPRLATDPYALSKVIGEDIARSFAYAGMQAIALRTVFVAYPEMEKEILARARDPENYKGPAVGGPSSAGGGPLYHHIDPRDVASAFYLALNLKMKNGDYDAFYLASEETLSPEPTLDRLQRLHGGAVEVRDRGHYEKQPFAPLYDLQHARDVLGFRAEHSKRHLLDQI
ncbi:NAD-dependent epimerase/dehydratase family protein [Neorhizobium sp. NCHU2750]|uniref:NAD-dependent epimerase/dehydratase family protein n=1 Tax=Neorhizobium sp. NCHU2750 TaxID=1825976 RepID=UPI000E73662E|nr:dehydratase [Neorhizobium sp. NCHU2750]